MAKARHGYIFVKCNHCHEVVEVKHYKLRRWKMKCPKCRKTI